MTSNAGVATAFATLSPFKSSLHFAWEALVLGGATLLRQPEPTMRKQGFLHHAYWIRVPRKKLRASPNAPTSAGGTLLFLSSFTGSQADYLRGFTSSLPREMDLIWACSKDWPGAVNNAKVAAFIGKYIQRAGAFFNAYGNAGVTDLRLAVFARDKLDEFATEMADADDRHFERAFTELATALLTDPKAQAPELA